MFHLSDEEPGDDGGKNLPVCRDDVWQDMLRMVLGRVPEGAEHAPPCYCEMFPALEKYSFAGLAGLPPAVRLMDGFFPVRDQSKRGACFAFALVALCEYMLGKTVELSESLTKIGTGAFAWCEMLENIRIPDNVTTLGDYAFIGCSALKTLIIPTGVTEIGKMVFNNCGQLVLTVTPDSLAEEYCRKNGLPCDRSV